MNGRVGWLFRSSIHSSPAVLPILYSTVLLLGFLLGAVALRAADPAGLDRARVVAAENINAGHGASTPGRAPSRTHSRRTAS